ncbi:ethylene receptor 2-like [Lolium rigidum]|uniref:ethylene receptor 2-like n=1 Tax=Lolium rigidum TaxID=89674 RepID=UPI001F5DE1C8|nr:ethylene receptor 2-like [Lolium rigidum]
MVGAVQPRMPFLWVLLFLLSLLPQLSAAAAADFSHCGGCDDSDGSSLWNTENILQCQKVSDFLIATAYFSIPLELLYFTTCSDLFPLKWILLQFGAFIVLCGLTHLVSVFTYGPHSFQVVLALTVGKFLTALVSFATAITLLTLIPQLLRVKVRENFLRVKARELDQEVGKMKRREETGWHVRMLTQEIRRSLDRHTVLHTTMVELAKTLELQNCAVWMPNEGRTEMILTHHLREREITASHSGSIPIGDPDVVEIKATRGAKVLGEESALGIASRCSPAEAGAAVAAIRMPMLRVSNFKGGTPEMMETSYAILVLVLPEDGGSVGWGEQELEIVEVIADQVAVALSHAAVLEESQLMREKLAQQHRDLLQAKHEAVMATEARNSFQSAMYDGMRRPMHSVLGLVSMMQQESMNPEQRLVMDAIVKTTSVASTLMNDVMQTSTMDREHLSLVRRPFSLHSLIKEAVSVVRCLSGSKGVDFEFQVENSLPERVVGDEKRVFHIVLHMVGTLLHQCGAGCLSLYVNSYNEMEERHNPDWMLRRANLSAGYVCVKFEIRIRKYKDSLFGLLSSQEPNANSSEMGLSFNMCKKIVQMMNGNIWSVSDPEGLRETVMLALQFQVQHVTPISGASSDLYRSSAIPNFNGLHVLLVDGDDTNRAVTHKLLEKLGCRVFSVSSGIQCMTSFAGGESSFQLLILDLTMHTMDGFEVALAIRKFRSNSWPPLIVALAASADDNVRDRCQRSGINGLLQKPVTLAALGDELYRVLQHN